MIQFQKKIQCRKSPLPDPKKYFYLKLRLINMSNINKCSSYHHLEVLLSPHPATPVPQFCDKVKIVQMAGR